MFLKEADKALITSEEHSLMTLSLNEQQRDFVQFHIKWCSDMINCLENKTSVPQYHVFLSGPGGVGKSHIIKLIHYETMTRLRQMSGYFEPCDVPILLTAFTGTAAFGINGMTLHSALGLSTDSKEYRSLGCDKLNSLRCSLSKLKLLVIDEISMVGADMLYFIHRRLQEITGNFDSPFGEVSILAVGDFYQLPPVMQSFIFKDPSNPYDCIYGSLWKKNFKLVELTEPMRQKGDVDFANLLLRVRKKHTNEDILKLKSRLCLPSADFCDVLHIFSTNKEVNTYNLNRLKQLKEKFSFPPLKSKKKSLF